MKTKALQLLAQGLTPAQVAEAMAIPAGTVRMWKYRAEAAAVPKVRTTEKPTVAKNTTVAKPTVKENLTVATPRKVRAVDVKQLRNIARDVLALGIVAGHGALIWYDAGQMWGMPGVIGGGVAFAVVILAILFAADPQRNRTSDTALWFVFFVDCAAWFVHYPTFKKYASIGNIETGVFAAFLCACSFIALYVFRDSKLD